MSLDRAPTITTPIESHELNLTRTVTTQPSSECIHDAKKEGLASLTQSSLGLGMGVTDDDACEFNVGDDIGRNERVLRSRGRGIRGRLSVWHKMDLCVLPVVTMIFFLSFLVSL